MTWFWTTVVAYLLFAISSLVDRYLLAGPLPNPGAYAFLVGLTGCIVLFLIPFGIVVPGPVQILLSLAAGAIWIVAIFFLYVAVHKSEVTRAGPAIGGLVPIFSIILVVALAYQEVSLDPPYLLSFLLLVSGGMLVSFEDKIKLVKNLFWFSLSASLFSVGFLAMKLVYLSQPFLSGLFWMRLGGLLASFFFLLSAGVRKEVFKKNSSVRKQTKQISLFLIVGGVASGAAFLLQSYAVSVADPRQLLLINALGGIRYVFLLVFVLILESINPEILKEDLSKHSLIQKIGGTLLICAGLFVLAFTSL